MLVFGEGWSFGKDGPGQRLVFHLKGCDMRCPWCANPEGISPRPQLLFHPGRASEAGDSACPAGALRTGLLERRLCETCASPACVEIWRDRRFEIAGRELSVKALLDKALSARHLFSDGGGVTFSGGEPTLQAEELLEALTLLREAGLDSAIESNASTEGFLTAALAAKRLICDLKAFDGGLHKRLTGIGNERVLENLRSAAERVEDMLLRVPLVSGANDSPEELSGMAAFVEELVLRRRKALARPLRVEVLRLHHLGEPKRAALGEPYGMAGVEPPSALLANGFKDMLRARGAECVET